MKLPDPNEIAQVFRPSANVVARVSLLAVVLLAVGGVVLAYGIYNSGYTTGEDIPVPQPVQFSHRHHVSELGVSCRYCHHSVERSSYASIPPTHTCMSCHSQVWTNSPLLEPVRESYLTGEPIRWQKVHDLADFVYFNHSIHVSKGVGCSSCHGQIEQMAQVYQEYPLTMEWCLECHRAPERYIRPAEEVFNQAWAPPEAEQLTLGRQLVEQYEIRVGYLTECYVCHR